MSCPGDDLSGKVIVRETSVQRFIVNINWKRMIVVMLVVRLAVADDDSIPCAAGKIPNILRSLHIRGWSHLSVMMTRKMMPRRAVTRRWIRLPSAVGKNVPRRSSRKVWKHPCSCFNIGHSMLLLVLHYIRLMAGTRKLKHSGIYWSKRWWGGSGISWTICKSFAAHSRQITMPVPHHSVFTGRMPFLPPSQQCQSTEDKLLKVEIWQFDWRCRLWV